MRCTPATRQSNRNSLSEAYGAKFVAHRKHTTWGMIVDVPEGQDPIIHVWGVMVPGIGPAAARFAQAVYDHSTLGLREFEAARLRIAQINGCLFCQDWRTERDGVKVEEWFADAVTDWRTTGTSTSARGWRRSTPSGTRSTTTASTTSSGAA